MSQLDMGGNPFPFFIVKGGENGVAGDGVESEGRDEFQGLGRADAVHVMSVLDEGGSDVRRLVRGNGAGDA